MWFFKSSVPIADSGILHGMTDCHSHLLPGVDDGVKTEEETWRILDEMERQGVRKVWLTPHIMEDMPNETAALQQKFLRLKQKYQGKVELALAAEYMLDNLFEERLEKKGYYPLLAHPERYEYMQKKDYKILKEEHISFQLNVPSLIGRYGRHVQEKAEVLLKAGMYDRTGCDIHSIGCYKTLVASAVKSEVIGTLQKQSDQ